MKYDKRKDVISWREYFMSMALLSAQRSKDPSRQVGCCIVADDNHIISVGYNGFPNGCSDDIYPWNKDKSVMNNKYNYVVHAEANAILNAKCPLKGCTLYVTYFPCNECTKLIIQSGIKKIVYLTDCSDLKSASYITSQRMLNSAGIKIEKYNDQLEVKIKRKKKKDKKE